MSLKINYCKNYFLNFKISGQGFSAGFLRFFTDVTLHGLTHNNNFG